MAVKKNHRVSRRRLQGAAKQAHEKKQARLAEERRRESEGVREIVPEVSNEVHAPSHPIENDCYMCTEQLSPSNAPRNMTKQCEHSITACHGCLERWVVEQAQSTTLDNISCPDCHAILQYQDMEEFAPADLLKRWEYLQIHKAMPTDERFVCCAHEGCNLGGICDPTVDSFVVCGGCNQRTCVSCATIYHDGLTCAEAKQVEENEKERVVERQREEEKTEKYFAKHKGEIKVCPNEDCGAALRKLSGCDHFTCSLCRYQFCWVCQAPWAGIVLHGNHYHQKDCSHYRTY